MIIRMFGLMFCIVIGITGFCQMLMIEGKSPDLYLTHSVSPKETWYSIGRTYNLSPKDIALANSSSLESTLSIGQKLKIPLTSANFSQDGAKSANEVLVPLYHTVQEKEWMYRISVNHNKVPIESLEKWNNISRDNAVAGTNLIVGFLKVDQNQSSLARSSELSTLPKPQATSRTEEVAQVASKPEVSEREEKKQAVVVRENPEVKKQVNEVKNDVNHTGGYFKNLFSQSGKDTSGVSGIFKSTSGWNDGKYYALMNNVPVGTVVKVKFPSTNKSIYAKVLGQLPDMKESIGLAIRISDAAATELGAAHSKFSVAVEY